MRGGPALVGVAQADALVALWAAGGSAQLFVGEFDGVVVGLLAVTEGLRAGNDRPSGVIECCYVETDARGVGVGTALMDAALAWCRVRGCGDVDATALPGDRVTKQRLEAAGFTARLLTLNRRLD